jgi:HAD superfamily hydrolase (TIGR01549 family)
MPYRLVIFDMDGTLTEELLDFDAIRRDIGLPKDGGILEHLSHMTGETLARAHRILDDHELAAAHSCVLHDGAIDVLARLKSLGIATALLTRNSRRCAQTVISRHRLQLDRIATREDLPHKPHPDSILNIVRALDVDPTQTLMVGDYLYDLQAAHAARVDAALLLVRDEGKVPPYASLARYCVRSLREIVDIVRSDSTPLAR